MGIIKKQGLQAATFSYIGVGIGFLSNAILIPAWLSTEQVGLLSFLNSLTSIFSGFFALGLSLVILNIFPKYDPKKLNGLYTLILIATLSGIVLAITTYFLGHDFIFTDRNEASSYPFFNLAFVLICGFRILFRNNESFIRMQKNTVLGIALESLVVKVILLISLVIFYFLLDGNFTILFLLFVFALSFPGIISQLYLWIKGVKLTNVAKAISDMKPLKAQIMSLAGYGILNALGIRIVMDIDRIMVSNSLSLDSNAIYSTAFLFGAFVNIPATGIRRISSVLISNAWNENDLATISDIYKKSCTNLSIVGFYLLLGVWLNFDFLMSFLDQQYAQGKYVMLIIGFAQLVDMTFGVNNEVLATSKLYRYTTYFMGILIILVVSLNALLIPILGIDGAAWASLAALIVVNIMRYVFLWKKFQLQPFSWRILAAWSIGGLFFFLPLALPDLDNTFLNIISTSAILTVVYWLIIYLSKLSPEINETINSFIRKVI